jgi:hypothetical protein
MAETYSNPFLLEHELEIALRKLGFRLEYNGMREPHLGSLNITKLAQELSPRVLVKVKVVRTQESYSFST